MASFTYPPSPAAVTAEKLNPSGTFKQQVFKVTGSIILFFVVYLLLVVASIGLAIACFYLGIQLIILMPKLITLIAGLGMVAVGISVIYFLIKFIFAVSRNENPNRVEITEAEQPELFTFIRQLSEETKTAFPKKIFISPDVNACVFYNSSFWSMFFPIRKNLEIGLALVNSINISELKAVIAHEFGHFSQRSMKLGSFTYNVNQIIHNMLYDNNSYTSFLNAWGRLHGILSFFASVTVKIAQGIQYILRGMYQLINKNYMGLSREMEFHADAVAASVAGGNNVISGLSRIEIAGTCYNTVIAKAGELLKEKKVMSDLFDNQLNVFREMAAKYKIPVKQGLPEISFEFISSFSTSRINYRNQWASHPELHERKAHLEKLGITVPADETSAWCVFKNVKQLKERLTSKLYSQVEKSEQMQAIETDEFDELYKKEMIDYALPAAYKGYYDGRYIEIKDWDLDRLSEACIEHDFDAIFTETHAQLHAFINNSHSDIETLKAIKERQIDVKSFDFDGTKYGREDCDNIIKQLENEVSEKQALLNQLDKKAFTFFSKYGPEIKSDYATFKILSNKFDTYANTVNALLAAMAPLYKGGLNPDQVRSIVEQLKTVHEKHLKNQIQFMTEDDIITELKNPELLKDVQTFLQKDYQYFANNEFMNDELSALSNIAIHTGDVFNDYKFKQYKKLLENQLIRYEAAIA